MKRDELYQSVTEKLIEMMEQGVNPWQRSWNTQPLQRPLRHNGVPYQGINVMLLWLFGGIHGHTGRHWFTFNQAKALGASVRKGEKSSPIIFFTTLEKDTGNVVDGKPVIERIPCPKGYSVFNSDQIDGLPEQYLTPRVPAVIFNPDDPIPSIDQFIEHTGVNLTHGGSRAYFTCDTNNVRMPHFSDFHTANDYYATLLHEMTHWTGHTKRIDRNMKNDKKSYAFEELIAELGAAFLCADLGISNTPREDHASYLQGWLTILKKDSKAIFQAAAQAQKACDYLHNLQPKTRGMVA
jgi:antirestriction protein ArdC